MKISIYIVVFMLMVRPLHAQLIGETDDVSFPTIKEILKSNTRITAEITEYNEGYADGYQVGYEDGSYDANTCAEGSTPHGLAYIGLLDPDYVSGHQKGWEDAYNLAYRTRISEKNKACSPGYALDEFFCECRCINEQRYYYDGDNDGYYDFGVFPKDLCLPPVDNRWKTYEQLSGIDCDDGNAALQTHNECGLCSGKAGLIKWYYDFDGDGFHADTEESCGRPTKGILAKWKTYTSGEDCDDRDPHENTLKTWYYFNDADTYHGAVTVESCERPTTKIPSKWHYDRRSGEDCDDNNPNVSKPVDWYYDHDGDGYHGKDSHGCFKPTTGDPRKWRQESKGKDCDDNNIEIFVVSPCGECGDGNFDKITAYIDFDGDGYHSEDLTLNKKKKIEVSGYTFKEEVTAPCPNLPLVMGLGKQYSYFPELGETEPSAREVVHSIFSEKIVKFPWKTIYKDEHGNAIDASSVVRKNASWRDAPNILENVSSQHFHMVNYWQQGDTYSKLSYSTAHKFEAEGFFTLPGGEKLWTDVTWWHAGYDAQGRPMSRPRYHGVAMSGLIDADNIISTTLGLDCNDFDPDMKTQGDWYYDFDQDGYYDQHTAPLLGSCSPPDHLWILKTNSKGPDCDDRDKTATETYTWFFYGDRDSYYGKMQEACNNPAPGTKEEHKWRKDAGSGADCDDDDEHATSFRDWYRYFDDDNFYGAHVESCQNPGKGIGEEQLWRTDPGDGQDCDDTNALITNENIAVYVDLDGDGYHSVRKKEDCGTPIFSEDLVKSQASNFPASLLIHDGRQSRIDIPGTSYSFVWGLRLAEFHFPDEVLKDYSLGLDCDDLDKVSKTYGNWYKDADEDGYYDAAVPPLETCSPPTDVNYILEAHSLGVDCDDDNKTFNRTFKWYKDLDCDGYYIDIVEDCRPPGPGWSRTSSIGPDYADANAYEPTFQHTLDQPVFAIPSLMKKVEGPSGEDQIQYLGNTYPHDKVLLNYRGIDFKYDDLIFDSSGKENRLSQKKMLIPDLGVLINAKVVAATSDEVGIASRSNARGAVATTSGPGKKSTTPWMTEALRAPDLLDDYHNVRGDIAIDDLNSAYFSELFDAEKFQAFKTRFETHHNHMKTPLVIRTFEEQLVKNKEGILASKYVPVIDKTVGTGSMPPIIIQALKSRFGQLEFVISYQDRNFHATEEELVKQGWKVKTIAGLYQWKQPKDEAIYYHQLEEINKFRLLMVCLLVGDFETHATKPANPPAVPGIPDEVYWDYDYGTFGMLTKLSEFFELGHHLSHKFEMPEGTWNPGKPSAWKQWKTKSPASLAGVTNGSLKEVKDMAEMVKLAQSLVHRSAWEGIMKSIRNFNFKDQVSGMVDSFSDQFDGLTGDKGVYVQHHDIGKLTVTTLAAIYTGWKTAGKFISKLSKRRSKNPKNALDRRKDDMDSQFKNGDGRINKSPEFDNLSKAQQEKLINDIAAGDGDRLKDALAKDSRLVDSWKVLDDAGVDDAIRKSPKALEKTNRYLDNGLKIEADGVVKQADGTDIGKLDMNDVSNPGELKVKGNHSGRHFDPDKSGGPIQKLNWRNADISGNGISDVERHLSRFGDDAANSHMIDRLKKIERGEITATDFDKRFYTHELTEYQRYKNLGVPDGQNPAGVWDNAHAASLEDYAIHERTSPIYHPDAPE